MRSSLIQQTLNSLLRPSLNIAPAGIHTIQSKQSSLPIMTGRRDRAPRRRGGFGGAERIQKHSTATNGQVRAPAPASAPPRVATPPLTAAIPSDSMRFADLGAQNLLHPILLQTITNDLKFDHMMPVQEATLRDLLEKRIDCLAQAKTGTGKTIAFLLPAIQTLINRN